ncbi:hypothetical protein PC116_g16273 [Phytophthora cactorum]|nr:hypothetical protein PC116_g16273 [Phytophthora cactorum]
MRSIKARSGPDALGLANTVNPLTFLARKPSADQRGANNGKQQQNPRRRRLRTGETGVRVAEIFSPQRSLRLSKLPMLATKQRHIESEPSNQVTTISAQISSPRGAELPLHELIQTMDDAVKADPMAELNQSAIARLFMDQWLRQFEADRRNFKSVAVRYEFLKISRHTSGLKHHKRLLQTLRKNKEWREDRNDVLADDIDRVYSMFRRFLSECTCALSRMLLHEWYSVAVVQKKNNRKYIAYYSNWFNSAPRAMLRKVYVAWKREAVRHRIEKIQKQMQIDLQSLTAVKRQADELTKQRDSAQADNLAMRNDRKQAEDWTRQLELRIKAASTFLDTTRRREAQVIMALDFYNKPYFKKLKLTKLC